MKKRKKTYIITIILSFISLYLICMFLATYIIKENYVSHFSGQLQDMIANKVDAIESSTFTSLDESGNISEEIIKDMTYQLSITIDVYDMVGDYAQYSGVIYGPNGKILARSSPLFGQNYEINQEGNMVMNIFHFSDYFTEEEFDQIIHLTDEALPYIENSGENDVNPYEFTYRYDKSSLKPAMLQIKKQNEVVFQWMNPAFPDVETDILYEKYNIVISENPFSDLFNIPYLNYGKEYWEKWRNDSYLQNIPEEYNSMLMLSEYNNTYSAMQEEDNDSFFDYHDTAFSSFNLNSDAQIEGYDIGNMYTIQFFQTSQPWHAAADYLKYVYLYGFVFMIVSMIKVIHSTEKTYKKQAELEQLRQASTNAIANRFDIPLQSIQENTKSLQDNLDPEEENKHLINIIEQTEVMDSMIKEMIALSKPDSNKT